MIDIDKYYDLVRKCFEEGNSSKNLRVIETDHATMFQEDIFKLYWMARVRFSSFVATVDEADEEIIQQYTAMNMTLARRSRSKIGELICVISVIICDHVSDKIKAIAETRPEKHTTSSEYLVIIDLSAREAYYYKGPIFYGILYEKFEREYIYGHFALPLIALSKK